MLKDRAKKYHEKIAQSMESMYADRLEEFYGTLAYQYSQSENYKKAYEYLKLSGIRAFENYSNQESYRFYQEALGLLKRLPDTEENKNKMIEIGKLMHGPMIWLGYPEGSLEILQNGERLSKEIEDKKSLSTFYNRIS